MLSLKRIELHVSRWPDCWMTWPLTRRITIIPGRTPLTRGLDTHRALKTFQYPSFKLSGIIESITPSWSGSFSFLHIMSWEDSGQHLVFRFLCCQCRKVHVLRGKAMQPHLLLSLTLKKLTFSHTWLQTHSLLPLL